MDATSAAGSTPSTPDLMLLTRSGCHLCEDARAVLRRVSADTGIPWREQSVDADPQMAERFGEELPVLFIDGVQRDFWQIDEARLRRLLASAGAE